MAATLTAGAFPFPGYFSHWVAELPLEFSDRQLSWQWDRFLLISRTFFFFLVFSIFPVLNLRTFPQIVPESWDGLHCFKRNVEFGFFRNPLWNHFFHKVICMSLSIWKPTCYVLRSHKTLQIFSSSYYLRYNMVPSCFKKGFLGAPRGLSWWSICFRLRSWSRGPGIEPCIRAPAQQGVCFSLSLCPSSPLVLSLSLK